jgi:hypothetical protein
LATRAEIVCGDVTLSWDTLERVIDELFALAFAGLVGATNDRDLRILPGLPGFLKVGKLCTLRTGIRVQEPRSILGLMVKFVSSRAVGPGGKKYGVLGLATDVNDPIFLPGYTEPPETLFRDFTRVLITRGVKLDILRFSGAEKKSGGPAVPSWTYTHYLSIFERVRLGFYTVTTIKKPGFLFSGDGNKLRLRGFIIDEIRNLGLVSSVIDGLALGELWTTNYYAWYCQAKYMFQCTGQDDEVLWRTLMANKLTDGKTFP